MSDLLAHYSAGPHYFAYYLDQVTMNYQTKPLLSRRYWY